MRILVELKLNKIRKVPYRFFQRTGILLMVWIPLFMGMRIKNITRIAVMIEMLVLLYYMYFHYRLFKEQIVERKKLLTMCILNDGAVFIASVINCWNCYSDRIVKTHAVLLIGIVTILGMMPAMFWCEKYGMD